MSTLNNITTVLDHLQIAKRGPKRQKLLLFIDFKKAFDSVDRSLLLHILEKRLPTTEKFELINKLIPIYRNYLAEPSKTEVSAEVMENYNEIMEMWPLNTDSDRYFKDSFHSIFFSCGDSHLGRLLLSFISKKILKHLIKVKATLNWKLGLDRTRNPNGSPSSVDIRLSPQSQSPKLRL